MKIAITTTPVNQADQKAAYMIVDEIMVADGTIRGSLYDSNGDLIAAGRVYSYSGDYKNIPFADLNAGEIAYLDGDEPDKSWLVETIKLWLDDHQTKDEAGTVSKEDSFYYPSDSLKAELLLIAKPEGDEQ